MRYSERLDTTGVFGISVRSQGNKDQSGLSYHLYYSETYATSSSEYAQSTIFWAIGWG